jgi:hypothetical protein
MIQKVNFGKHKDCVDVIFGTGDIMFHGLFFADRPDHYVLGLTQTDTPRKIGAETNEFTGKNSDELPSEVKVMLSFTKPESVTALIHSLIELQQRMFDKEQLTTKNEETPNEKAL